MNNTTVRGQTTKRLVAYFSIIQKKKHQKSPRTFLEATFRSFMPWLLLDHLLSKR